MAWLNRYSFVILGGLALAALAAGLIFRRASPWGWGLWGLLLIAWVAFGWAMRARPSQPFTSAAQIEAALKGGQPTLVYWFSNY